MAINYVRFQRGTMAAYNLLVEKDRLDANTLYFIYADSDSSTGSLYLGDKLISGGDINYVSTALADLSDVDLTGADLNSFLLKSEDKWVAKSFNEIVTLIQDELVAVPVGDNTSIEVVNNILQLKDFGVKYQKYIPAITDEETNEIITPSTYEETLGFIEGLEPRVKMVDGKLSIVWYEPSSDTIEGINAKLDTLSSDVADLIQKLAELTTLVNNKANSSDVYTKEEVYTKTETETAIATAVANSAHLARKIVEKLEDINVTAEDAERYIYMVPTGLQVDDDKYDEYIVIEGKIEKVGSWEVDLTGYATITQLQEVKDTLTQQASTLQSIQQEISKLEGAEANYIKAVNTNNFEVSENGTLSIVGIEIEQINGLQDILNNNKNYIKSVTSDFEVSEEGQLKLINVSKEALLNVVGDVTLLSDYEEGSTTIVSEINNIKDLLIWKEMSEEII